ncbi:MAG: D-alanine--D-alanine ligase [Wenzhouxiangellaceae bacterium]
MSGFEASRFGRIGLVFGGFSAEREVSLKSGAAVAAALRELDISFQIFDGARAVVEAAAAGRIDCVFNMLHGRGGEDGCLQGALSLFDIPVTGSGVLASALAMDKVQTKRVWRACGLPTPDWRIALQPDDADAILRRLSPPLFVKPAREGSSVGMSRVESGPDLRSTLKMALEAALHHDRIALVETMIRGPEYTAAILGGEVLPLIRIDTPRDFYDYSAKYESEQTRYQCPAGLNDTTEKMKTCSMVCISTPLDETNWFSLLLEMTDADGKPWLLEANTVPGMTDHSLVPMAAEAAGIEFTELVLRILATTGGRRCAS